MDSPYPGVCFLGLCKKDLVKVYLYKDPPPCWLKVVRIARVLSLDSDEAVEILACCLLVEWSWESPCHSKRSHTSNFLLKIWVQDHVIRTMESVHSPGICFNKSSSYLNENHLLIRSRPQLPSLLIAEDSTPSGLKELESTESCSQNPEVELFPDKAWSGSKSSYLNSSTWLKEGSKRKFSWPLAKEN